MNLAERLRQKREAYEKMGVAKPIKKRKKPASKIDNFISLFKKFLLLD